MHPLISASARSLAGCTEMRVEGDAKVFQSSAIGTTIRIVIGLGLIGLGIVAFVGSLLPDRKPKNRRMKSGEGLSTGQRVGLALFGGAMGFAGFFLAAISFLFPSKLHVTVYPDRVAMASTYSQTGGREVVVPFADLTNVELRDEPNIVGKLKTVLVFTLQGGKLIKADAGNNERQALETIRQALAEYQKSAPPTNKSVAAAQPTGSSASSKKSPWNSSTSPQDKLNQTPTNPQGKEYKLQRYAITSPLPEGYRLVAPADSFEAGTKLKANWGSSWYFVTIVESNNDGTITCNWDNFPSYTYKMMREDLVTADPTSSSNVTSNAGSPPSVISTPAVPQAPAQEYRLKRYKINIPLPQNHKIVAPNDEVKVGTKLQACYSGHWEYVTVVAVNEDGTISCNWDQWTAFTYKMVREDLVIAK